MMLYALVGRLKDQANGRNKKYEKRRKASRIFLFIRFAGAFRFLLKSTYKPLYSRVSLR